MQNKTMSIFLSTMVSWVSRMVTRGVEQIKKSWTLDYIHVWYDFLDLLYLRLDFSSVDKLAAACCIKERNLTVE